jgi:hypothetical protein
MKKLAIRIAILLLPLAIIIALFVIVDPMKVVHDYADPLQIGVLMNDRHYQARYLMHNKIPYESFVVGSSRSKMFRTPSWQQHIGTDTKCLHLGVNDESIWGLLHKLEYIDRSGYKIKHCLFPLDHRLLRDIENNEAHIFRDHPLISGETYPEYYKFFFIAFINPEFLSSYFRWTRTHQFDPATMKSFIWHEHFTYHHATADITYTDYEDLLAKGEDQYYEQKKAIFYPRDTVKIKANTKVVLTPKTIGYLNRIKALFDKHHTSYRLIVTPNYDQIAMTDSDYAVIQSIFGKQNITNHSGINALTHDVHHYYEERHFRPFISDSLMNEAYSNHH